MEIAYVFGVIGGAILVAGAAWSGVKKEHPVKSLKNWLLAVGAVFMITYSILNYIAGGPVFFIFLQALAILASILMFLDTDDRIDVVVLTVAGAILVGWSLYLFEDYSTLLIILGIIGIGIGYALDGYTIKRNVSLAVGAVFIVIFSWIVKDWIFFWLNIFFALFSAYHVFRIAKAGKKLPSTS